MKTKTLLIAAAALAVGVISSQAQAVYSANIVGYVTKPLPTGYSSISIPLNYITAAGITNNALTNTIPNTGALDGANLYVFNGHSFDTYTFDSGLATGFGDAFDTTAVPTPVIAPGTGFYINNNTSVALSNVFVGNVALPPLAAGVTVTVTNTMLAGKSFIGSIVSIGGGVASSLGFTNSTGALDGTQIFIPNIVGGNIQGYNTYTYDSGLSTGFGDAFDTTAVAEPQVPLSSGFLYDNNAGLGPVLWVQKYTP